MTLARAGVGAWRLLGVGALIVAALWLAQQLMPVLLPVVVAVLLATLLHPVADALERRRAPRALATTVAMLLVVLVVVLALALIVPPFVARLDALGANVEKGVSQVAYSALHDVAGVSHAQVDKAVDSLIDNLKEQRGRIVGGLVSVATAVAGALAAIVLVLFLCFFLVKDGRSMWAWTLGLVGERQRDGLAAFGARAWSVLGTYIRGVVFVATVDATFIGIALVLVGVPLALPLIVLTWVAAFFPIVGAIAAGVVSVLVALVSDGLDAALIILAAIIVVQQLEGNVLYPAIVGPRLKLHPIVVLVAVTIGGTIGGIAGAFLAVPVATVCAAALEVHRERAAHVTPLTLPDTAQREGEARGIVHH